MCAFDNKKKYVKRELLWVDHMKRHKYTLSFEIYCFFVTGNYASLHYTLLYVNLLFMLNRHDILQRLISFEHLRIVSHMGNQTISVPSNSLYVYAAVSTAAAALAIVK